MADFEVHTVETAPDAAKPLLEGVEKRLGFIPNLMATMAESPALLEAYTTLSALMGKTGLSAAEQQVITMTNNRLNGCHYCMAAHTTGAQAAKVPTDVIDSLRAGTAIADPKLEALRQFAIIVNETRGAPTVGQVNSLIAAGYPKATVFAVILGTAFKVLSNYTNNVAQAEVDRAFEQNRWSAVDAVD